MHFNPLKDRDVNWLHLAIQVKPTFLISDIRALWRSALVAHFNNKFRKWYGQFPDSILGKGYSAYPKSLPQISRSKTPIVSPYLYAIRTD